MKDSTDFERVVAMSNILPVFDLRNYKEKKFFIAIIFLILIFILPFQTFASERKMIVNASDLVDAIDGTVLADTGTIVLNQDVTINESIVFSNEYKCNLTIDLNGHTLKNNADYAFEFMNGSGGSVTITGNGKWENSQKYRCYFAKWDVSGNAINDSSVKVLLNGDITYYATDQPFFNGRSNLEINNGKFRTKMAVVTNSDQARIFDVDDEDYLNGGNLTINGGTFYSVCNFGGVRINGGVFKSKVYFTGMNQCVISGGKFNKGIYTDANLKITGGMFYGNGIEFETYSMENRVFEFAGGHVISNGKYGIRINEMCYENGCTKITGGIITTTKKNAIGIAVFHGKVILQSVTVKSKNENGKYGIFQAQNVTKSQYTEGVYLKPFGSSQIYCKGYNYGLARVKGTKVKRTGKAIILSPRNEQKRYNISDFVAYRIKGNVKVVLEI